MNKLKKSSAILDKKKMAAIKGHLQRGTDPYFLYCYHLAMYQVPCFYHKMNDSSQNCYISAPLVLEAVHRTIREGDSRKQNKWYFFYDPIPEQILKT